MRLAESIFKLANSEEDWEEFKRISDLPDTFKPRYQFWMNHFVREWVLILMIRRKMNQRKIISFNGELHGVYDSLHGSHKLSFLAEEDFVENLKKFMRMQIKNAEGISGSTTLPLGQWVIFSAGYMGFCFEGYKDAKKQSRIKLHIKVYSAFFLKQMFGSFVYDLVGSKSIPEIYVLLEKIAQEAEDLMMDAS